MKHDEIFQTQLLLKDVKRGEEPSQRLAACDTLLVARAAFELLQLVDDFDGWRAFLEKEGILTTVPPGNRKALDVPTKPHLWKETPCRSKNRKTPYGTC